MGKVGKISSIKKEFSSSQQQTMQSGLANRGLTRIPGTGSFKYPYKERDNKYRTGLDPKAAYISRIQDPVEKDLEIERVTELRKRLEEELSLDLSPTSEFWQASKSVSNADAKHVQPFKLLDGDNQFPFDNPQMALAFAWLRVHPTIASSMQAYERGEYPADTQWFVSDDEIENKVMFKKKQLINKAIIKFDAMTPDRKKKVARLLGLPVTEDTREEEVYNLVDDLLKQTEFKNGKYQGLNPIEVFHRFADMKENLLHIRDLVKQAITHSVYRVKTGGKIYEGEAEIAKSDDDLVKYLADEDHQEDLLMLEQNLKRKKLAAV